MKQSFAEILRQEQLKRTSRLEAKLPSWASVPGMELPSDLCLEQCSSEPTALFKASLLGAPASMADLTGGIGADCWAFSKVAGKVLYFERNQELAEAARRNFQRLGASNISVSCATTDAALINALPPQDWIYLDPARRDSAGKKVFLLEDCTPDVLTLLPALWEKTSNLMLKLSPMADISLVAKRLGDGLTEVHTVCLGTEVKELLCILRKGSTDPYRIHIHNLDCGARMSFLPDDERNAEAAYSGTPQQGMFLHEPCAGLLKAGAFKLPCKLWGLYKLAPLTHLYTSTAPLPEDARPFFKTFEIERAEQMGGAAFRDFSKSYPKADVSARAIPMTSEQLRAKLKCAPSNDGTHIFGCTAGQSRWLLACRRK